MQSEHRPQDFLITTSTGGASRRILWHGVDETEIDLPGGWVIERTAPHRVGFRNKMDAREVQLGENIDFEIPEYGKPHNVELPDPRRAGRNLRVSVIPMQPLNPVYMMRHMVAPHYPAGTPKQLMQFYGQRYSMVRFTPVPSQKTIRLEGVDVFNYGRSQNGFVVRSHVDGLRIKTATEKVSLRKGDSAELREEDFFSAALILGSHWWRFRCVPTPDSLPAIETEESEDEIREAQRVKQSATYFYVLFALTLLVMFMQPQPEMPKPKMLADVQLKRPVILPPIKPIVEKPKPKPIEKKPEPPKIVEAKPTPPVELPKPKTAPPKKVVKLDKPKPKAVAKKEKKPEPKKIAKRPTPPKPAAKKIADVKPIPKPPPPTPAPPAPPEPVKPPEPDPKVLAAQAAAQAAAKKAAEQAAIKQQLVQKLKFLSTSSKRTAIEPTAYDDQKEGRFTNTPTVGGEVSSTNNALDKIVKDAPGDGRISTKSSRTVSSAVNFGSKKGKGLNEVQGKVSLGEIYNSGKMQMSGDPSLSLSGPGEMSESEIEKALAKYLQRFQFCYEKALLSDSSIGGNLTMQWTISTSGSGGGTKVVSSQMNNKDLHNCVSKVLKEIPFPHPKGGVVVVKKTFSFSSSTL